MKNKKTSLSEFAGNKNVDKIDKIGNRGGGGAINIQL
jgi:hypothetical protein